MLLVDEYIGHGALTRLLTEVLLNVASVSTFIELDDTNVRIGVVILEQRLRAPTVRTGRFREDCYLVRADSLFDKVLDRHGG